jgi:outer membrane biosynthesis protein TonB
MPKLESYWKDKDKRKGLISTVVVHLALLFIFLFMGLTYYEPKPEDGIVINFGYSATGMGDQSDGAEAAAATTPETNTPTETQEATIDDAQDPVMTQDAVDAPSIPTKSTKKTEPVKETPKVEEQKPSNELSDLLNQVNNTKPGGEGVAGGAGDQGDPTGDPDSPNRTGGGGGGNGGSGNYMLGSRKALEKPNPTYECAEEGRVVVKIYVDRNGKVSRAIPGDRVPGGAATTTTSSCLFEKAKTAAMNTTWQSDNDAPTLQTGYIIYNFKKR